MRLIPEFEVAKLLGVDRATLRRWRASQQGPSYIRLGPRLIRYQGEDVEKFIQSHRRPEA
jgi:predicted DNA-binding transcriptional regulator AlpA